MKEGTMNGWQSFNKAKICLGEIALGGDTLKFSWQFIHNQPGLSLGLDFDSTLNGGVWISQNAYMYE